MLPLVEQTQHDAFAVDHRDDRHADVDFAAGDLELDAAVLRQPLFGDVQLRHDLQPRDDRREEVVDRFGGTGWTRSRPSTR